MKKVIFITVVDIYDKNGNGGVKGSQRNLKLISDIYGRENVMLITFPRHEYTTPPDNAICWERTQNNLQHLIAAIFGCKVYFPWNERKMFRFICDQKPDILFIDSSMLGRMAKIKGDFLKVVFFHNVEASYAYNKVKNEGIRFLPSYYASKSNEKKAMLYADKVICLNMRDKNQLSKLYEREADYILPVTMEDVFDENKLAQYSIKKNTLLFVGAFMPQNIVSIEWFIENVMSQLPDICLDIVGKGFEKKASEYSKYNNVNVIGTVDDLDDIYYSHNILVLPILYGAGMKIKTAEALMYGRQIIASDEALEGYNVEGVKDIYRCNNVEEYVKAIRTAVNNMNKEFKSVRNLFLEKYETHAVLEDFRNFLIR